MQSASRVRNVRPFGWICPPLSMPLSHLSLSLTRGMLKPVPPHPPYCQAIFLVPVLRGAGGGEGRGRGLVLCEVGHIWVRHAVRHAGWEK